MKWRQLVCLGLLATSLSSVGTVNDVQAATWHRGTPKALRGLYQSTEKLNTSAIAYLPVIEVEHKLVSQKFDNMPELQFFRLKYRKSHGKYYFKGWFRGAFHDSHYKRRDAFGIKKHGHGILFYDGINRRPVYYRKVSRVHVIHHYNQ